MYVSIVNEYGRTIQINTRQINFVQIDGKTMFLNYFGGQSTATSSNLVQIQTLLTVLLAQSYFLDLRQNGDGFLLNLSAIRYTDFAPIADTIFVYFNAVNIIVKLPASLEPLLSSALATYVDTGGGGTGNGTSLNDIISQPSHGFAIGDILGYDGSAWFLAQADTDATSEVYGIVSSVTDQNTFTLTTSGYVAGLTGLIPGGTYFLSESLPGSMSLIEPTTPGQISKPIFLAMSTNSGLFVEMRGELISSGGSGGGNGTALSDSIMQINHGFSIGDAVRFDGTEWVWSQADSDVDSEVYGLVSNVIDLDNFTITTSGYIVGLSGLIPGTTYFLSAQIPGGLTSTEPLADGQVSKPLFLATSSSSGLYIDMRGELISIGGSPDTYTNETPTPVTVGGIPAGSTFVGLTTQQMWDWLLYSIHP